MIEIYPNLYIGNESDYENHVKYDNKNDWFVIHACKDPYHRDLLGYHGQKAAPKEHPEYFFAERPGRLILNLIDPPKPDYIPKQIIDKAISTIIDNISSKKVLVHCNQGQSRSAIIGLLYLARQGRYTGKSFEDSERDFFEIYPNYQPGNGTRGFAIRHWLEYAK